MIDRIKALGSYPYLASPFSKYETGLDAACCDVSTLGGKLIKKGLLSIYSPIAHSFTLAYFGDIDPRNHKLWLEAERPRMEAASCMIIAMMDGWRESFGIAFETNLFRKAGKPIFYIDPETLEISEEA